LSDVLDIILSQLGTIGGPVLIGLLLVSVAATATSIYKIGEFLMLGLGRHAVGKSAITLWRQGETAAAVERVTHDPSALSRVLRAAMTARTPQRAQQSAVIEAQQALAQAARYLRLIEAVVQAAPMLGLLGTVLGMIEAFGKVAQGSGAADPGALANGIWIALTTTALGLAIAIPFYFISVWLEGWVDAERAAMDLAISQVTLAE
jgi:biopolymer transport protein ExbB